MIGSVRKRGNQSWRLTIVGRDKNGNRKRKCVTVRGTRSEAQRQLREMLQPGDKGTSTGGATITVGKFLEQWLHDYAEINTSPVTTEGYRHKIRCHVLPKIGHVPLDQLTPQHVIGIYVGIQEDGLSRRTALHVHRILHGALNHAVKWAILTQNVCDAVDPPRPLQKQMAALDTVEVGQLLQAAEESPYRHIIFLAIYTGLRRGELLGLHWADVDLKHQTISVSRSVHRLVGQGLIVTEPKTRRSRRLVTLPPTAVKVLAALKTERMDQCVDLGANWSENNYVFCHPNGGPLSPDTVTHAFNRLVKRTEIPHVRFHDLRHTHATLMLKQGVNPKIVCERLGHSSVTITMDTYSHVLPGMQEQAALAFEAGLEGIGLEVKPESEYSVQSVTKR